MNRGPNPAPPRAEDAPPPPYTETDIYSSTSRSQPSVSGPASHVSSSTAGDPILTPPESPIAGSYFETRPALPLSRDGSQPVLEHRIVVAAGTGPDDIPYNTEFASRDVTEQDWATFRNYLLPDHSAKGNDEVVERKLRREDGSEYAEAQLGRIRRLSQEGERLDEGELRKHAFQTAQEWNSEFFGPRGLRIVVESGSREGDGGERAMPGSWDPAFEERSGQDSSQQEQQEGRSGWRRHLDRVKVSDHSLRIGDSFIADVNGLKIGGLVGHGFRMDGGEPQPPPRMGGPVTGGFGQFGQAGSCSGFGRGGPTGWGECGTTKGAARGRSFGEGPSSGTKQRSHSVSSSSSSSSSSSESSLGSLPDYDEINDAQLPLYADRLSTWVNNPQTVRTRQDVEGLRAELKALRKTGIDPGVDRRALRKRVKELRGEWRSLRKEQRRERRRIKRAGRGRRRQEKQERRRVRREGRQANREIKRERRESRRESRTEGRCGDGQQTSSSPCGNGMGAPGPWGMGRRTGSWGGMFANRGLFGPQGSFDPQFGVHDQGPPRPGPFGDRGSRGSFSHSQAFPGVPQPPRPFPHGVFGPQGGSFPRAPFSNMDAGTRTAAPPGAWPEDNKVRPEENKGSSNNNAGDQETGVMDAQGRGEKVKELEAELERRIMALDGLDEGKEREERLREIEVLMEKLDGLKLEGDEALARELSRAEV